MPKSKIKRKKVDAVLKKARAMRSGLLKYGIRDYSVPRLAVILQQGVVCPYCKEEVPIKKVSIDHILPRSKGGPDTAANIHFTCLKCNRAKGNLLHEEFILFLSLLDPYPEIKRNVLGRLRAGGFIYGR